MDLKRYKIIFILTAAGGLFLIRPIFSFGQSPQDFPMMEMTVSVNKEQVGPGDFLTYTIYFRNVGHSTAFNVELEDLFPKGTSFESTSFHAANLSRSKIEYSLPDFIPGDSKAIFIKLRVNDNDDVKVGTTLINENVLSYKDGRKETPRYLVAARTRSLVGTVPADGKISQPDGRIIPVAKVKEITAPVGSHALFSNLGLAFLLASLGAGLTFFIFRIR